MSDFENFVERHTRFAGRAIIERSNPYFLPVDAAAEEARAAGREFISFAHYDYLDLGRHPAVSAAIVETLGELGPGAGASRLVGGERTIHQEFEADLARFVGKPAAVALVSGYLTNLSLLSHITGSGDLVVVDEFAHNSIMASGQGRAANFVSFRHNDLDHLESILVQRRKNHSRAVIAVEGLYSMDGDVVDLPRLLEIKERHDCWVLLDEAHCLGVLGATGRGTAEHFGVDPERIDLITGTLSKSLVTAGGFIAASPLVIQWLRFTLPGFVYSVGLPPILAAGSWAALRTIRSEPERVARLHANSEHFRRRVIEAGLNCGKAIGRGVVPVHFSSLDETMAVAADILEEGFYAPPIVHVGVPKEAPRIRFFISARHTHDQIERLVAAIERSVERRRPVAAKRAAALSQPPLTALAAVGA